MSDRYLLLVGGFYKDLAERLERGARTALTEEGVDADSVDRYEVPGAFELPLAAKVAAQSGCYRGVVCLGAVIRGETDHYEHVCREAARGIQDAALQTGVPCTFGVLTCEDKRQALARSGGDKRDQGYNAARAMLRMVKLLETLRSG